MRRTERSGRVIGLGLGFRKWPAVERGVRKRTKDSRSVAEGGNNRRNGGEWPPLHYRGAQDEEENDSCVDPK
jgi:hypothetical protein